MSILNILYIIALIAVLSPFALMAYSAIKDPRSMSSFLKGRPAAILRYGRDGWKEAHRGIKVIVIFWSVVVLALSVMVWVDERHIPMYLAALMVIIYLYCLFFALCRLVLDIVRKDFGRYKTYIIVVDVAAITAGVLAVISYFQNKTELAALLAVIVVIGGVISKAGIFIWTTVLLPFLSSFLNLPATLRDILLGRYIGKWLDARKGKKRVTSRTSTVSSKRENQKASQAQEREKERQLL